MDNCEQIRKLLPSYLKGICSEEEQQMVEQHMKECSSCHVLLEKMKNEPFVELISELEQIDVRKDHFIISKRLVKNIAGIMTIILFWILYHYIYVSEQAGNIPYPFDLYSMWGAIIILVLPLVTVVWLGRVLAESIKEHSFRKNLPLLIVLTVVLLGQIKYKYYQAYEIKEETCWVEVLEIPDRYHIVIQDGDKTLTLETTSEVTRLVQIDGSEYEICYQWNKKTPDMGKVLYIRSEADFTGVTPSNKG